MIELPSGCSIARPLDRMRRFCRGEYIYYDSIASTDPDHIEPLDVLATVAVNSFVNSASRIRSVHQGLRNRCDPLLPSLPQHADLVDLVRWSDPLRELLDAAVQVPYVLLPVATKVLHRKRRSLIPMLDNVLLGHYLRSPETGALLAASQSKAKAADVALRTLELFRSDLAATSEELASIQEALASEGFPLTPVRILEVLIWTEVEPRAGYRTQAPATRQEVSRRPPGSSQL
jgi:hypothetical protein